MNFAFDFIPCACILNESDVQPDVLHLDVAYLPLERTSVAMCSNVVSDCDHVKSLLPQYQSIVAEFGIQIAFAYIVNVMSSLRHNS